MQAIDVVDLIYRRITLRTGRWHAMGAGTPYTTTIVTMPIEGDLGNLIERLHGFNYNVWHAEDICRSGSDEHIPAAKRIIDQNNQARCDAVEKLDEMLINHFQITNESGASVPYNSETPGSIVDRISVNELKIYHTEELIGCMVETNLESRLCMLVHQRNVLIQCLTDLLNDMSAAKRYVFMYKQHKMYNDPTTNPLHKDRQ